MKDKKLSDLDIKSIKKAKSDKAINNETVKK